MLFRSNITINSQYQRYQSKFLLAMADGISTRMQREIGQQQKELERVKAKLDGCISQLRVEMEQLGTDMRRMFEQMMLKMETNNGKHAVESVDEGSRNNLGIESSQLKFGQSGLTEAARAVNGLTYRPCKHSHLDYPKFKGEDFSGWFMKLEQFFEAEKLLDGDKIRMVMMHLEGRAL